MVKFTKPNSIHFIGKPTELLEFLKYLSNTYLKIEDIQKTEHYI